MKVLNLYAGIGGNRKLWEDVEVTAVEINEEIAGLYKQFFPKDNLIVGDAHEYLLEHYKEFDFIWSSPPCPSHSRVRKALAVKRKKDGSEFVQNQPQFPDMKLYEEVIFLDNYFDGNFVVENVKPYYEPLIKPQILGRHCFWTNFPIKPFSKKSNNNHFSTIKEMGEAKGFDLTHCSIKHRKDQILRNCVDSDLALHIFESLQNQGGYFDTD